MLDSLKSLGSFAQVLALLRKVKISDLGKIADSVQIALDSELDLQVRVIAGIDVLDVLADYTETPADDQIVEVLRGAARTEALWSLIAIVQDLLDGNEPSPDKMDGPGLVYGAEGETKTVPWALIIEIAKVLISLFLARK